MKSSLNLRFNGLYLILCSPFTRNITYEILKHCNHKMYIRAQIARRNHGFITSIPQKRLAKIILKMYFAVRNEALLDIYDTYVKLRSKYVVKYTRNYDNFHLFARYHVDARFCAKYLTKWLIKYLYDYDPSKPIELLWRNCEKTNVMLNWYLCENYDQNIITSEHISNNIILTHKLMLKCVKSKRYDLAEYYSNTFKYTIFHPIAAPIIKCNIAKKDICDSEYLCKIKEYFPQCSHFIKYYAIKYNNAQVLEKYKDEKCDFFKCDYYAVTNNCTQYLHRNINLFHFNLMSAHKCGTPWPVMNDITHESIYLQYFVNIYHMKINSNNRIDFNHNLTEYPSKNTYPELQK
jgi:hypothetical protein